MKRNIIADAGLAIGTPDPHIEPPSGFFLPFEGMNRKARRAAKSQGRRARRVSRIRLESGIRKKWHRMQARSRYALARKARLEREAEKNGS